MNETGKTMRVTERHIGDEVEISFRKTAGNEKCNCKITANNAASAINGICIIVQEYASALQLPALHVLAVMAALMADPESEHGEMKEEEKESDPNAVNNIPNMEEMEKEIISIINTHADDDGWVDLSELGDNLPKRVPGFDPRNYKCTKLKQFIEMFDSVEVRSARNPHNKILSIIYVRVKQKEEKPVLSKVRRGGKQKKNAAVVVTGME